MAKTSYSLAELQAMGKNNADMERIGGPQGHPLATRLIQAGYGDTEWGRDYARELESPLFRMGYTPESITHGDINPYRGESLAERSRWGITSPVTMREMTDLGGYEDAKMARETVEKTMRDRDSTHHNEPYPITIDHSLIGHPQAERTTIVHEIIHRGLKKLRKRRGRTLIGPEQEELLTRNMENRLVPNQSSAEQYYLYRNTMEDPPSQEELDKLTDELIQEASESIKSAQKEKRL